MEIINTISIGDAVLIGMQIVTLIILGFILRGK